MAKLIDLTGQKFDKLLVLEKAPSRARHTYWKCQCDCGNICEVSGEYLKKKILPRDCGCSKIKNIKKKELEAKKNHLVGKRFGKLVVLAPTEKRINNSVVWKCKCDCGNYKEVPTHLLTSGHTQSCGCLIREVQGKDITGQRFGKLTVLYPCDYKKRSTIMWHCKCDCGNECDVDGYNLRAKLTNSCGCLSASIGEINIAKILKENNISYKKEYTTSELNRLRYDFAILNNKNQVIRLVEFDGIQHFTSKTGMWNNNLDTLETQQERDKKKNEFAKSKNIPLVRIPYWERDNITLDMILGDKYLI